MSALAPAAVPQAWWPLWHEPWVDIHPGWWTLHTRDAAGAGGAGPAGTPSKNEGPDAGIPEGTDSTEPCTPGAALIRWFAQARPSCRLGYRWFCQQFAIDAGATGPRPFPLEALQALPPLPLGRQELVAAATALGRVGYASHCLLSSRQGLARLFSHDSQEAGSPDAWREALRQARARPLTLASHEPPPPGASAGQLQRWALPLMARLIEDAIPGAWGRLRLRFDPQCFALEPLAPAPYPVALQRQAWRIWRAAGHHDSIAPHHETSASLP